MYIIKINNKYWTGIEINKDINKARIYNEKEQAISVIKIIMNEAKVNSISSIGAVEIEIKEKI